MREHGGGRRARPRARKAAARAPVQADRRDGGGLRERVVRLDDLGAHARVGHVLGEPPRSKRRGGAVSRSRPRRRGRRAGGAPRSRARSPRSAPRRRCRIARGRDVAGARRRAASNAGQSMPRDGARRRPRAGTSSSRSGAAGRDHSGCAASSISRIAIERRASASMLSTGAFVSRNTSPTRCSRVRAPSAFASPGDRATSSAKPASPRAQGRDRLESRPAACSASPGCGAGAAARRDVLHRVGRHPARAARSGSTARSCIASPSSFRA